MNKTKIEWVKNPDGTPGYTWNPITGCLNGCSYCYARRLANGRLKQRYLANKNVTFPGADSRLPTLEEARKIVKDPFYPRFWEERLDKPNPAPHNRLSWPFLAKGIFVCDMGELFGDWIPKEWQEQVFHVIQKNPWHRFYILTKQPQNLVKFSPFSGNCWVGVTATEQYQFVRAVSELRFIEATIKYLSFEPLLAHIPMLPEALTLAGINWVIIGAMTGNLEDIKKMLMEYPELALKTYDYKRWTLQPRLEWVEEIVKAADEAGIPVFFKYSLKPLFKMLFKRGEPYPWAADTSGFLKQEMPKVG